MGIRCYLQLYSLWNHSCLRTWGRLLLYSILLARPQLIEFLGQRNVFSTKLTPPELLDVLFLCWCRWFVSKKPLLEGIYVIWETLSQATMNYIIKLVGWLSGWQRSEGMSHTTDKFWLVKEEKKNPEIGVLSGMGEILQWGALRWPCRVLETNLVS